MKVIMPIKVLAAILVSVALPACASVNQQVPTATTDKTIDRVAPTFTTTKSNADFGTTLTQLRAAIDKRGLKTFAVIDHAAGAASIGENLRPTTLIIFGNPKGGTPLLQAGQSMGIDLPLKALVAETEAGDTVILTTHIKNAASVHKLDGVTPRIDAIATILQQIADEAAQ